MIKNPLNKNNLLYKCGWSPFEGITFSHSIERTFVNGGLVYEHGSIVENNSGMRLKFNLY